MKKICVLAALVAVLAVSLSAQEQIGGRLKYEIVSASTGSCMVRITDIYDNNSCLLYAKQNLNDIYTVTTYMDIRVGAANLYTDEFKTLITNYIITTQSGGHSEWRIYASTIAEKFEQLVKSHHPRSSTSSAPAPAAPPKTGAPQAAAPAPAKPAPAPVPPRSAKAYYDLAERLLAQGKYREAITEMTEAIRLYPHQYMHYYRGKAYLGIADYDRAVDDFSQLIHPDSSTEPEWCILRGDAYFAKGDYDRAVSDYTRAIDAAKIYGLTEFLADYYKKRAKACQAAGNYTGAIADYEAALRLDPDDREAREGLADSRRMRK